MKQQTQNTFAAILAAAQAKANEQTKQNFTEPVKPEPIPAQTEPEKTEPLHPSKMVSFTILWHEGTGEFDGREFTNWWAANLALHKIYRQHGGSLGYTKVKVCIKWENGAEITDRLDVCKNDFNPMAQTAGEYLKKCNSVMYESNLEQGTRNLLQWEDEPNSSDPEPFEPLTYAEEKQINDVVTELLNPPQEPEQPKNTLQIIDYSDKAFAVIGETKPIKETLKALGGRFNMFLKCGAGWIFPKTKLQTVKIKLSL
jgi:hypothetical protein